MLLKQIQFFLFIVLLSMIITILHKMTGAKLTGSFLQTYLYDTISILTGCAISIYILRYHNKIDRGKL